MATRFSNTTTPIIASIGIATMNSPARANPIRIRGSAIRQIMNFEIPQHAFTLNIIILKKTTIIAIVNSMIIVPTSLSLDYVFCWYYYMAFIVRVKEI